MVIRSLIALFLVGTAGIYADQLRVGATLAGNPPALDSLPREIRGWRSEELTLDETTVRVLRADRVVKRIYRRSDGAEVGFFVAYFARQQVNSQIHSPRNCLPGAGWRLKSIRARQLRVDGEVLPVTWMGLSRRGAEREVLYWFETRGGVRSQEYALKWQLVKDSIARRPTDAAMVRYDGALADSIAVGELIADLQPHLRRILSESGM